MADEQKSRWWSTLPGLLTAGTGFVAALTGLVAGLNQLGVFRRDEPASARVEVTGTAPRETTAVEPDETTTAPRPAPAPARRPSQPSPVSKPSPALAAPAETAGSAPVPTTRDNTAADTAPADTSVSETASTPPKAGATLPSGTALELATALRVCAPESGARRFTALLAGTVRRGGAVLQAGTPAVLRIRRTGDSDRVQLRFDSLLVGGSAVAVRRSEITVPRGALNEGCLKPGARVRATLAAPVTLPP